MHSGIDARRLTVKVFQVAGLTVFGVGKRWPATVREVALLFSEWRIAVAAVATQRWRPPEHFVWTTAQDY